MSKTELAIAALLCVSSACYAASETFVVDTPGAPSRLQRDLVADYGATCDGKADDSPAFRAFKAAFQGATPVQLNLPAGTCTFLPGNGQNLFSFKGVRDLIVAGQGAGSTTFKSLGGNLQLGGSGQYQDNNHSVRTDTANAGDSCVTIKTHPAVTVSAITTNFPFSAVFIASVASNIMTVTAVRSGTIAVGAYIGAANSSIGGGFSAVQAYGTGGTTGTGGTGTYSLTGSPGTITSQTMRTQAASFTATVDATGVMTVSAVADGSLAVGMTVWRELGRLGFPAAIKSQLTGSAGGVGTYQLSVTPANGSAFIALSTPSGFLANGQPRVTLNSTSGLTSGDSLYLKGITGRGGMANSVNGLRWIKVINGTQIDVFQSDFNNAYTSGGTGGGDRTSLFPVGSTVLMTGWSNQSYWAQPYGFPSNPQWFEYKTVASVNSTTHQVCFTTPLENTYKSTWPQMNTGSSFEVDPGGPATLYAIDDTWNMTLVVKNLSLDVPNQTYSVARNVTYSNVTMVGAGCAIPTQNEVFNWTNVTGTDCTIETDKIVKTWNLTSSTVKKVHVQSSSIETININTVTADKWQGTSKYFYATNFTATCNSFCTATNTDASFEIGTGIYGAALVTSCTNCSIAGPSGSTAGNGLGHAPPQQLVLTAGQPWSMSGGIITIPNAYSWSAALGPAELQYKSLVPGHYAIWRGSGGGGTSAQFGRVFKIVDVTQDLDNVYIQTSEAGGFPAGTWTTNGLSIMAHPAPQLTMASITGAASATVMNGCPAATPMYSCANVPYTDSSTGGATQGFGPQLWGVLDTFTFTNNVPYTGSGALGWTMTRFANTQLLKTDNTTESFGATNMINMKLPSSAGGGTRTLTPSGATGTQSLDSLTAPSSGAWFGGNSGPIFTANTPSDSPQITATYRLDQQLPP